MSMLHAPDRLALLLLALAALGVVAVLLVRRTEPAAAPRQGQRFETTHDGVRVVGVDRLRGGGHALQLAWEARHHIDLDGRGAPLGVTNEGPGTCTWKVPGRGDQELLGLRVLGSEQLSLTEQGRLETAGSRTTRRVLMASTGVLLDLRVR